MSARVNRVRRGSSLVPRSKCTEARSSTPRGCPSASNFGRFSVLLGAGARLSRALINFKIAGEWDLYMVHSRHLRRSPGIHGSLTPLSRDRGSENDRQRLDRDHGRAAGTGLRAAGAGTARVASAIRPGLPLGRSASHQGAAFSRRVHRRAVPRLRRPRPTPPAKVGVNSDERRCRLRRRKHLA